MRKFSKNIDYLRQYVNGKLTPTEMYEIERAMHEDEMLMDIIEGLETEKALKSAKPTIDLHTNIKLRTTSTTNSGKLVSLKKLFAAASIIAILSIGGIYILNIKPTIDPAQNVASTKDTQIIENPKIISTDTNSSLIALNQQDENETITIDETSPKIEKNLNKHQQIPDPKKIIVYSAKPKMQVVIDGPKFLNPKSDEEIITIPGRDVVQPIQSEILVSRVGTTFHKPTSTNSLAKTSADLQRLNIDPQTKANLSAVLARQADESKVDIKDKQTESSISEVLINGNALANKNIGDSRIVSSFDAIDINPTKTIQNGNPSNGWGAFNAYIRKQLKKKGYKTYNVNLSFDLDVLMRPTNIEIKTSSNPKIDEVLIDILKNGPTWENKNPNHPIYIRINSEEEKN